ncbi:putative regulator of chromosome condensation 1/beta-lactamase-inhibitor protein II [Helianthus annuus]|nr:putative regulator of chromosome condensation 1/beta-lactamase-inhibitor protein II [Helianthus annuus]
MEQINFLHSQRQNHQTAGRKSSSTNGSSKDLWLAVQSGCVVDVDSALVLLKKNGGNINSRNAFGLTALHIATWRNHIPIIKRLLAAGADPNARDGESGWSSLHRSLHFGHLAVASILLKSEASVSIEDSKSRTPVDLLSGPVLQANGNGNGSVVTELYSWGSGVNYQLGTGNAHIQKLPCKVDSLHGSFIKLISSAKFHSVAVSANGEVYTWGFGRGGRLGHPDFDIHSGQAAVITPRQVTSGLGARRVRAIAAAKHHTVAATDGGEVFTWGSNREGQLGYTSVDTQATPRRVSSLKSKIVAVAAANKHTAVVSDSGEVFTWGCNKEGQLGYGTSNSGSNYTPRLVEYLKGKVFIRVSAAKYHTMVLGADGEVFTWGHRLVNPRRVVVARLLKKSESTTLKFHRSERLHVVSIAAGMTHSIALTHDGALFYWVSSDPDLRCQQLYSLCGKNMVSVSAGKYWTAGVTATGDVYMWDGKKRRDESPVITRLHGVKRATSISVGETHLLVISSLYHPPYCLPTSSSPERLKSKLSDNLSELDEDFAYNDNETDDMALSLQKGNGENKEIPTLKSLCEKVAAEHLVEPRSALQLLEIADSLEAHDLRKHCEEIVIRNLDYIFTVSTHAFASASLDVLANLEKSLDLKSSELWSHRRLPTPTATFPAVINSEEDDSDNEFFRTRDNSNGEKMDSQKERNQIFDSFLQPYDLANHEIGKQVRALRKKLQQIEILEEKRSKGYQLDSQQIAKLQTRPVLENSLVELGVPIETIQAKSASSVDQKNEGTKKQRKKSRRKQPHGEEVHGSYESETKLNTVKGFSPSEDLQVDQKASSRKPDLQIENHNLQEKEIDDKGKINNLVVEVPPNNAKKEISCSKSKNSSSSASSKKKNRKGGLSMFLSGALDDTPKIVVTPPTPKSEGPAWGGASIPKGPTGPTSLRKILDEQGKTVEHKPVARKKDQFEVSPDVKASGKLSLSSFLPSNPIPMGPALIHQAPEPDRSTPPWISSGTPPLAGRPSLKSIQLQQEKKQQTLSQSPKTKTTGFSVTSGQGSPSDSGGSNKWFKPEVAAASSIRSIQIEEKAMKDLKRFYSSVKVVVFL